MRLVEIRLHNFRQFAGEQSLHLAGSEKKNVTLLFGANGSGKTTLLNAFTWALYGHLSSDLEDHKQLITNHVWDAAATGSALTSAVEVHFEHGKETYRVRREVNTTKASNHQELPPAQLRLWVTQSDGRSDEVHAPQQKIEAILPEQLSRFFFFNGERIENLVNKSAYAEVKQAIKTLLGLEQVERALEHLPKVERKLNADLRKHGGERAADIATRTDDKREKVATLQTDIERLELETSRLSVEHRAVLELLSQHQSAGPLQQQRAQCGSSLASAQNSLEEAQSTRRRKVAEKGFLAFTHELALKVGEMAEALRERGQLPAPIKRDFVDGLLDGGECICGTPLAGDSPAHLRVKDWRERAGLAEVESSWQRLRGDVVHLPDARLDLAHDLESSSSLIVTLQQQIRELAEQKTSLDAEIAKLPLEDVQGLESKRELLEQQIADNNRQIGVLKERRETFAAEVDSLLNELKNAEIKDELALKARRRIQLVQEVHSALNEILDIRTESVRNDLNDKIQDVFKRITIKPFLPELTPEFELSLTQERNGERWPVPKSTGENQILSLSFVAAVSELAREYRDKNSAGNVLDAGGSFPLVMDAAFGSLDENYQREVSRALPGMAPQMLVLVSKSQGLGTVYDELSPHIGAVGVVVAHTTNQIQEPEDIELSGRSYPYASTRESTDWAELVGVEL